MEKKLVLDIERQIGELDLKIADELKKLNQFKENTLSESHQSDLHYRWIKTIEKYIALLEMQKTLLYLQIEKLETEA
ncbi:hypothetical protein QNI16_10595 [Cytophagaceae bacterium YF14B1]|uniref:Uncharacterized protein n=1 Tax=Xanthocytophaga flava TaxID=3048013 RepID=A0AAE3U631_9BACT|nr:hypothetical protein [Xanthocytophaga flavus]MDJ1480931.1 hypothetical protein [Xanthocytophaga flavus]